MGSELHANADGYVACPRRGEVSVEWCAGCPYRLDDELVGDRIVVTCAVGPQPGAGGPRSPLRDVPDLWR